MGSIVIRLAFGYEFEHLLQPLFIVDGKRRLQDFAFKILQTFQV